MKILKLILDCPTRWGSSYEMYNRAFELRKIIDKIVLDEKANKRTVYDLVEITEMEWSVVFLLLSFLKPFHDASKVLESKKIPTINLSISVYTELFSETELFLKYNIPKEYTEIFRPGVEEVQKKLTFYFNRGTLIHFMAMVLDVRIKDKVYNRRMWKEDLDFMLIE